VQDFTEEMRDIKEAALDMTLYFLRDMNEVEAADALQGKSLTLSGLMCFWGPWDVLTSPDICAFLSCI